MPDSAIPSRTSHAHDVDSNRIDGLDADAIVSAAAALPLFAIRELGPTSHGGRLDGIVVTGSGDILVASPGGGVWLRERDTTEWRRPANRGLEDYTVVDLQLDVIDPQVVYAVAWNGVYRSDDVGEDWTLLVGSSTRSLDALPSQESVVDPKPFAQLRFSATERALLWGKPCDGLWWSFDGFDWRHARVTSAERLDQCIGNIAPDPETGVVYLTTLRELGPSTHFEVFRSIAPWSPGLAVARFEHVDGRLRGTRGDNLAVAGLASASLAGSGVPRMVAILRAHRGSPGMRVNLLQTYLGTEDESGAFAWQWTSDIAPTEAEPATNAESPRSLLHTGVGEQMFHGNVAPRQQLTFAEGWQHLVPLGDGWLDDRIHRDFRAMFLTPQRDALWATTDGTSSTGMQANIVVWPYVPGQPVVAEDLAVLDTNHLATWQAYYAAIVSAGPVRRVFAGSQDNGALCFSSATFPAAYTFHGAPSTGGDQHEIAVAPSAPNRAYAVQNAFVLRRTDNAATTSPNGCGAVSWYDVLDEGGVGTLPCFGAEWDANQLVVHPGDPSRLYLACDTGGARGVNVSSDGGQTWVTRPLPDRLLTSAVHVDRYGTLFAGAVRDARGRGGIYVSLNEGETWFPFGFNRNAPERVLAIDAEFGRDSWMSSTDGLYRHRPACGLRFCWTRQLGRSSARVVTDIVADPACQNRRRVYVAFGNWSDRRRGGGGLRMTTSGGDEWFDLTAESEVRLAPIMDIDIDRTDSRAITMATFGRGVWSLEWLQGAPPCE